MKTPDEIKKGLSLHRSTLGCDNICPYDGWNAETGSCIQRLMKDTVKYIEHLESRLVQVERERKAAVRELEIAEDCYNCKYNYACKHDGNGYRKCSECGECPCSECNSGQSQYEWRGVCEENTKEDADENTEKV